jgi:hypothetical protein
VKRLEPAPATAVIECTSTTSGSHTRAERERKRASEGGRGSAILACRDDGLDRQWIGVSEQRKRRAVMPFSYTASALSVCVRVRVCDEVSLSGVAASRTCESM